MMIQVPFFSDQNLMLNACCIFNWTKKNIIIVETFLKNNLLSLRPQKLQNNPDKIKEFSIHKRHSSIPPNQTKSCMNKLRTLDLLYCISRL